MPFEHRSHLCPSASTAVHGESVGIEAHEELGLGFRDACRLRQYIRDVATSFRCASEFATCSVLLFLDMAMHKRSSLATTIERHRDRRCLRLKTLYFPEEIQALNANASDWNQADSTVRVSDAKYVFTTKRKSEPWHLFYKEKYALWLFHCYEWVRHARRSAVLLGFPVQVGERAIGRCLSITTAPEVKCK